MAIQITDDDATIKYRDTTNDIDGYFNKASTSVRRKGNSIRIWDDEWFEEFDFAEVTIPVTANADALASAIEAMLPSSTSGSPVDVIPPSAINDGRKTVTSGGTAETLIGVATPAKRVTIVAEEDNTGIIVAGGSTVVAALGTRQGVDLGAGDSYELDIDDLQKVFIDTTVDGDGVTFTYFN